MMEGEARSIIEGDTLGKMTRKDERFCMLTFAVIGTSCMFFWNSALDTLYSIITVRYPSNADLSDTFTGIYTSVAFLTAVSMTCLSLSPTKFHYIGLSILIGMAALYPVAATYFTDSAGQISLFFIAGFCGMAEMFLQVSGYALSVILPRSFASWLSWGYGICGAATFFFWELFSQGLFDISQGSIKNERLAVWSQSAVTVLVLCISGVTVTILMRQPYMKQALVKSRCGGSGTRDPSLVSPLKDVENPPLHKKVEPPTDMTLWHVFAKSWDMQIGIAVTMGLSMFINPNIAPYQWHLSIRRNDILVGLFQLGDCLGRLLPNVWQGFLLPRKAMLPLALGRVIMVWLFIHIAEISQYQDFDDNILLDYGVQVFLMLMFSMTHGWYASIFMHRVPENLENNCDKTRASAMAVTLLVLAISIGMWLAKLVNYT